MFIGFVELNGKEYVVCNCGDKSGEGKVCYIPVDNVNACEVVEILLDSISGLECATS